MPTALPNDASWGAHAPSGWRQVWLSCLHALPAGNAWRRLALWLRKPLKSRLHNPVDVTIWGLRLRLQSRGNLSEQRLILMPQFLDRVERETLARELAGGGVFLDIGANIGVYSYWVAATCGPAVRVEAFEPDPLLGQRLRHNLALNPGLAHLHLNPVALGAEEGEVILMAGVGNAGENRIVASAAPPANTSATRVRMTTLPTFLRENKIDRIDALKIDVEGHEVAVLEPLFNTCPRETWPRLVVCEVVKHGDTIIDRLLATHGYTLTGRGRLNGIYRLTA